MRECYEPHLELRDAQRLFGDQVIGPESTVNIGGQGSQEAVCVWQAPGIRIAPNWTLSVANTYLGLFEVNPITGG
ncbi:unnamed protein product [Lota lota]